MVFFEYVPPFCEAVQKMVFHMSQNSGRDIDVSVATICEALWKLAVLNKKVAREALERDEVVHDTWLAEYGDIPMELKVHTEKLGLWEIKGVVSPWAGWDIVYKIKRLWVQNERQEWELNRDSTHLYRALIIDRYLTPSHQYILPFAIRIDFNPQYLTKSAAITCTDQKKVDWEPEQCYSVLSGARFYIFEVFAILHQYLTAWELRLS